MLQKGRGISVDCLPLSRAVYRFVSNFTRHALAKIVFKFSEQICIRSAWAYTISRTLSELDSRIDDFEIVHDILKQKCDKVTHHAMLLRDVVYVSLEL